MLLFSPMEARMYNDRIMMLERAFLDSAGTPQNPLQKCVLSSTALYETCRQPKSKISSARTPKKLYFLRESNKSQERILFSPLNIDI